MVNIVLFLTENHMTNDKQVMAAKMSKLFIHLQLF